MPICLPSRRMCYHLKDISISIFVFCVLLGKVLKYLSYWIRWLKDFAKNNLTKAESRLFIYFKPVIYNRKYAHIYQKKMIIANMFIEFKSLLFGCLKPFVVWSCLLWRYWKPIFGPRVCMYPWVHGGARCTGCGGQM